MALKLLVSGFENTGKTSLITQLDDVLIINCDTKVFSYKKPYTAIKEWKGFNDFKDTVNQKIKAYKTKYGKLPTWVVFDTITQLYSGITRFCNQFYRGFEIHNQINKDTQDINYYIENTLIANDINVIIVAHVIYNDKVDKIIIPANGQFAKAGSWTSVCNEAIYVNRSQEEHKVYFTSPHYPARTLAKIVEDESVDIKDFNFKDYTDKLLAVTADNKEYEI